MATVTDATPWLRAVRASHDRLSGIVAGLDAETLRKRSYDTDWSIADVLSHLGSGAEIFSMYVNAGVTGGDPPSQDAFKPVWDTWNARSPEEQAARSVEANEVLVAGLESLTPEQREAFGVTMFGAVSMDLAGLLGMRLSEHAVHTWDIAVALDPSAAIAPDAVDLLVDQLQRMAGFMGKKASAPVAVAVTTTSPDRALALDTGGVTLGPAVADDDPRRVPCPARGGVRPARLRPSRRRRGRRRQGHGLRRDPGRAQVGVPGLLASVPSWRTAVRKARVPDLPVYSRPCSSIVVRSTLLPSPPPERGIDAAHPHAPRPAGAMTSGDDGLPKYARVAAAVRGQIAAGALLPGQPAPSGAALSRLTGFSTLTCRRALRVLIADGLLMPGPSRNARPRVAGVPQQPAERDLAAATRALSAGLAARRRAHGLTQPELAALTGVSVTTVGHAETGRLWQSRRFWEHADAILDAAGGLLRLHDAYRQAVATAGQTARDGESPGGRPRVLTEAVGWPRSGDGDDAESSERVRLPHQATAVPAGLVTPTCVTIVWGDGSVTTVHPPRAPGAEGPPGEPEYPG